MAERKPQATEIADRIAGLEPLDSVAEPIASAVRDVLPGGPVKDALSGTWLGHALHPVMQLAPLGTWMSAVILDLIGGEDGEAAADRLIATGLLASVPTLAPPAPAPLVSVSWATASRSSNVSRPMTAGGASPRASASSESMRSVCGLSSGRPSLSSASVGNSSSFFSPK